MIPGGVSGGGVGVPGGGVGVPGGGVGVPGGGVGVPGGGMPGGGTMGGPGLSIGTNGMGGTGKGGCPGVIGPSGGISYCGGMMGIVTPGPGTSPMGPKMGLSAVGAAGRSRTEASTRSCGLPFIDLVGCNRPDWRLPGERSAKSASGSCSAARTASRFIRPMAEKPCPAIAPKNRPANSGTSRSTRFHLVLRPTKESRRSSCPEGSFALGKPIPKIFSTPCRASRAR